MKKLLYIVPLLLGMALTSCYDEDIENINSRLDAIENTQIATISQQITSINNSIQLLTDTDTELKGYIATLEKDVEQSKADIETLRAKDSAIEKLIAELRSYVDSELKSAQDWATATFATLEQHNALATELASLKTYVEGVESTLNNAISALETSMKEWVNEQLTGYYTIAEIDAKLEALETATTEGDEALQKEIDALKEQLASQKTELTEAYNKAIEEAINTNNGAINETIAAEISSVNEKIGALEERLDSLEERISAVEDAIEQIKALDITFDTTEKACMAGASVYIGYTIIGGDAETAVDAWGDGGWSASVICESSTAGKIKVTAPVDVISGKVVVLVTSGAGGVKMKSLHFVEGILTNIHDTYEVIWEACTLNINLKTNLNYTVNIPTEVQEWISLAQTRAAVRNETLTFSIAENPEEMVRSATLDIVGECGDVLQSFEILQKAAPTDGYVEFADKYAKLVCVEKFDINGDDEISFKEASKVTNLSGYFFGDYAAAVVSFDELQYFINLTSINTNAFRECSNLTSIIIPNSVTTIGEYAFWLCKTLTNVTIGNRVASIGGHAFDGCESLKEIIIPNSVTTIGGAAFEDCTSISSMIIPNSVTSIGGGAFAGCTNLESIILPDGISTIATTSFLGCANLTKMVIPDSVTLIEDYAFQKCAKLTSIVLGKGITHINSLSLSYCPNLTSIYSKATNPPSIYSNILYGSANDYTIYVPTESVWLYQTTKWKSFADSIVGYDFE